MKRIISLAILMIGTGLLTWTYTSAHISESHAAAQEARKLPETIQLAAGAKLGTVSFSHVNHTTKNYAIDGTGPIACIECHHTAQPASEVAKRPPLKTAWPTDRTTTLTVELIEKDPKAAEVIACRSCHAKQGEKPTLLPEIPQIKHEGSAAIITLTNQQAFHRTCGGCHDGAMKLRQNIKAPATQKCTSCHKK
jgi:hypothetical protein